MNSIELAKLLDEPEGQFLEFKQEWFDLATTRGKAKFAKTVMAMANGLSAGSRGHIVIGREDQDQGGRIVGVEQVPTAEQLTEILGSFARPVPITRLFPNIEVEGKTLSVIEVSWSDYHPYYATRDVDSILSTEKVVIRQDRTTRFLSPPELEMMIRAKDARIGSPQVDGPLVVGFVDMPSSFGSTVAVRIRNVTEEPVEGISAVVDIERVFPPGFTFRMNPLTKLNLRPGATEEFDFKPSDASFHYEDGTPLERGKIWCGWLNVTLYLLYRDRNGIIQTLVRRLPIGY